METVLINPYPEGASGINEATIEPPLGLAYLAAVLEKDGHTCQIIDANILRMKNTEVLKNISYTNPDCFGISMNVITCRSGFELIKKLRQQYPSTLIIIGGPYPSSLPKYSLEGSEADLVVIGEGELTMREIMNNFPNWKSVHGIAYKENGQIFFTSPRSLIENLDTIPFPAYHLLPDLTRYKTRARRTPVGALITSRGCPYQCTYCNKDIFQQRFRTRSPESVVQEVNYLVEKFHIKQLDILDDNFSLDIARANEILDLLIKSNFSLAINLQNGVRADKVDYSLIRKMKKAGVFKIAFGVETGNLEIQKTIKKKLDLEKVIQATRWAKKEKIIVYGNFMLGLPNDTSQTMQETIDFALRMNPDIANFMITVPFPGTELYCQIQKQGKFLIDTKDGIDLGFYGDRVFYELGITEAEQVLKYYRRAYREFYWRFSKIIELLKGIKSLSEFLWLINVTLSTLKPVRDRNREGN